MSATVDFVIDGKDVQGQPSQTLLEAAEAAGVYIPRLCYMKGLSPHGSCRVCTCLVNGRPQAACTQPIAPGMVVEANTEKMTALRREIIQMLFVEGNHFCAACEKSGNCELQALAYRFGIGASKYPFQFPVRDMDGTHADVFIDRNRCILCGRCVRSSRELDGKHVFDFVGRGPHKRVAVDAATALADTDLRVTDKAAEACPVGAIIKKRTGYTVPVGQRLYDQRPIGSEVGTTAPNKK